jgi:hypothetical protein
MINFLPVTRRARRGPDSHDATGPGTIAADLDTATHHLNRDFKFLVAGGQIGRGPGQPEADSDSDLEMPPSRRDAASLKFASAGAELEPRPSPHRPSHESQSESNCKLITLAFKFSCRRAGRSQ